MNTNFILKYAERGYKIFPIQENGKAPATKNGFKDATDDPETIKKWWDENPNYNIGLPLALNGLIAIDIDRHKDIDGFDAFEKYIISNELSDLPLTVEAVTANNGIHKIFKAPDGFKPVGILTEGVDLKYNGYIVIAPSKINCNFYEWVTEQGLLDIQPALLPEDWQNCLIHNNHSAETEDLKPTEDDYPPSNAEMVAKECDFIRHCIDDAKTLSEPEWKFGLIGVIPFCEGGADFAHKWSKPYPDYTYAETQEKIKNSLEFGKPTSCSGIQLNCGDKYCKNCLYNGKITSPIVLGYNQAERKVPVWDINFPVEVFPTEIQKFISDASYVMDAPVEYFASSILAITGFLINSQAFIIVKNISWKEPAVLWILIVGEAGRKKKTPVYKFMKSILDNIDETLEQEYQEAKKVYQNEILKYNVDLKNWKENAFGNPPEKPTKPVRTLIYTSDTTIEAISYHQSQNPHGIGVMCDEISGFFMGFNKYQKSGNDRQYYLGSFSGDKSFVLRKQEDSFNTKPYHNIFGTIQPPVVANILLKDFRVIDGFVERFLFSLTNHVKKIEMVEDEIDEKLKKHVDDLMLRLYKHFSKNQNTEFTLDDEAKAEFKKVMEELNRETLNDNNSELLQSYLEKCKTYIPRFALVLHCLEDFANQTISKSNVENAYKIVKYFINCFKTLTVESIDRKNNDLENFTITWLKAHEVEQITPSELFLSNKSRFKTPKDACDCLTSIAKSGFGRMAKTHNGGQKWQKAD